MPNPKEGSVTPNVAEAVKAFSGGKAKYRVDDGANLHLIFGKRSFENEKLANNLTAFLKHLMGVKPTGSKGTFIESAAIASTMSPGVAIDVGAYVG
jgi:large subunit ribosomal protein L1